MLTRFCCECLSTPAEQRLLGRWCLQTLDPGRTFLVPLPLSLLLPMCLCVSVCLCALLLFLFLFLLLYLLLLCVCVCVCVHAYPQVSVNDTAYGTAAGRLDIWVSYRTAHAGVLPSLPVPLPFH